MNGIRGLFLNVLLALGVLIPPAAGALGLLPANAGASVMRLSNGAYVGAQLRTGATPAADPAATPAAAAGARQGELAAAPRQLRTPQSAQDTDADWDMDYNGGPVLHTTSPYLVFWDPDGGIATASRGLLERYLTDVSINGAEANDVFGVGRQYYDTSGYADAGQTFSQDTQAISDDDPYPASGCSTTASEYPTCLTDEQIQTELAQLIAAKGLPTGRGSTGTPAPIYFVSLPADVNECDSNLGCASNDFCSYHGSFADGPSDVIYAVIPFLQVTDNPKSCQQDGTTAVQEPNGSVTDLVADDLSHENNESITDPIPPTGWYDISTGQEAADNCEEYRAVADPAQGVDPNAYVPLGGDPIPVAPATHGTLYDQLINGDEYYTQTLWSNGDQNCEPAPTAGTIVPSFTVPSSVMVGEPASFTPAGSIASNGFSSATWSFGDDGTDFEIGNPQTASHTYTMPGVDTVSLTLVDSHGNLATVSHTIVVLGVPTVTVSVAPTQAASGLPVVFNAAAVDPNAGARIAYYRWTFGDGSGAFGSRAPHTYAKPGAYLVTVTATDSLGLSKTASRSVTVQTPGRIESVTTHAGNGTLQITIRVNQAGRITLGSRTISLSRGGSASFRLTLSHGQRVQLSRHHDVNLKLPIVYIPQAGPRISTIHAWRIEPDLIRDGN